MKKCASCGLFPDGQWCVECGHDNGPRVASIYAPGTNDSTHCEPCNGGAPGLCKGWAKRPKPDGALTPCATWTARMNALNALRLQEPVDEETERRFRRAMQERP